MTERETPMEYKRDVAESFGCAKGYAWAMNDAGKGETAQRPGNPESGVMQFAAAFAEHVQAAYDGEQSHTVSVSNAWRTWQKTMGLTVDYLSMLDETGAREIAATWFTAHDSALYLLATSGAIHPSVAGQIEQLLEDDNLSADSRTDLERLLIFTAYHGPRGRVLRLFAVDQPERSA